MFKSVGKSIGLNSIGAQTMRKTFAWRYYKATNDIYYLQNLLNHASPAITYRYIGEKPNVEVVLKKMTPEKMRGVVICSTGRKRQKADCHAAGGFELYEKELDNPTNNDAFYGRVDCLLTEMEDLVENFKKPEKGEEERPYASAVFSDRRISRRDSFSRMEARFSMRARASQSDMR